MFLEFIQCTYKFAKPQNVNKVTTVYFFIFTKKIGFQRIEDSN